LLASCAPYPSDPAALRGIANGIESAAVATRQAEARQATATRAVFTEQARRTYSALEIQSTALAITATALDQAAYQVQLERTAGAATIESAQRGQLYQAKGTEIWLGVRERERKDNRNNFMLWSCGSTGIIALLAMIGIAWLYFRARIVIMQQERTAWLMRPLLPALPPPVIDQQGRDVQSETLDFLRAARQVNGAASDKIPHWSSMPGKWRDSRRWQEAKNPLESIGAVRSIPRKWTCVTEEFGSLQGLIVALERGEIGLTHPSAGEVY
jgi:hypothetical protein